MDLTLLQESWKLDQIEWAKLPGERPREAGCNARLGVHGKHPFAAIAKINIGGMTGFGLSRISNEQAQQFIGTSIKELFTKSGVVKERYRALEFPLLDWLGKLCGLSVSDIFRRPGAPSTKEGVKVPCYDTTLYFDELHITEGHSAIEWMRKEAQEGKALGHRNFKIKTGRGARWMNTQEGLQRDIKVIMAVREVAGPNGRIMIDANNGYTLNMTKEILLETKDCSLYWIEEAFHEDRVLYEDLREWMEQHNLHVKIADGEGHADPRLIGWAKDKVVDILQYDIISPGFSAWLELGARLDDWGVGSAPHSYGNIIGNYVNGHLAGAIQGFQFVEWDHADVNGLDGSAYRIEDGYVVIPDIPGFGLQLDDALFNRLRRDSGWIQRK